MMARLKWYLDPLSAHQLKKYDKVGPTLTNFLDRHMIRNDLFS